MPISTQGTYTHAEEPIYIIIIIIIIVKLLFEMAMFKNSQKKRKV